MAPGYVLAIGFELAGAVGLVLGLVLIRAEHRAKAMGLKTFLTSGNPLKAGAAKPAQAQPAGRRASAARPAAPQRASARRPQPARAITPQAHASQQVSEALNALRRAYARGPGGRPA